MRATVLAYCFSRRSLRLPKIALRRRGIIDGKSAQEYPSLSLWKEPVSTAPAEHRACAACRCRLFGPQRRRLRWTRYAGAPSATGACDAVLAVQELRGILCDALVPHFEVQM